MKKSSRAVSAQDKKYMLQALELAARAKGRQRPNPMVGALLVKVGKIVGQGYHSRAGQAHAEVKAIRQAGKAARGATLYVTLEPCAHHGRTSSCAEAVIAAGIARVVYAMRDPNPQVAGRGLRKLRAAGIDVRGPVCRAEAEQLNRPFIHWMTKGESYVIAKVGSTLDGKIVDHRGASQWITNAQTRNYVHEWRARCDAILVGAGTVKADNPSLRVRLPKYSGPQPTPIIWLGDAPVPWKSKLLTQKERSVLCIFSQQRERDAKRLAKLGHDHLVAASVPKLLPKLAARSISTLMVEGGPHTLGAFLRAERVNYCIACLAPLLLGGKARSWTDDASWALTNAPHLQVEKLSQFADNVVVEGNCIFKEK